MAGRSISFILLDEDEIIAMTAPMAPQRTMARSLARMDHRPALAVVAAVSVLVSAMLAGSPSDYSKAVGFDLRPSRTPAAQVRIFDTVTGRMMGGGTLVAPHWVLTAAHLLPRPYDAGRYAVRFGVTNGRNDATNQGNVRAIQRTVVHDGPADLAMMYFPDAVPPGTWIPRLGTEEPPGADSLHVYAWSGGNLFRMSTNILGASAENANFLRQDPTFGTFFRDVDPLIANFRITNIDQEGSGTFWPRGSLVGITFGNSLYRRGNGAGGLRDEAPRVAAYEIPVWRYRSWIQSVIDGEGSSSSGSSNNEPPRRRLTDSGTTTSDPPMTMPPQTDICDEGETSCTTPDPVWARGVILGSGNYRGTAYAMCAKAAGNECSFDRTRYAVGEIGRLPLGTSQAPEAMGTREVMAWCKTSTAFTDGAPPRPALRVSFTNADQRDVPAATGWWDVTPDQVGTGSGQILVDPARLTTCS